MSSAPTSSVPERGALARPLTLVAMSLGFGVVQLDVSVVNVAVRTIGVELGGAVSDLQWVVNAYTIGFASFILTAGALGDRIGARRVFVGGFAAFLLASVGCAVAPSLGVLIGARALQGCAAAVLVPSSLSLLNHAYTEPAARARAVGLWLAGASLALAIGPLVGGVLIAAFGWRAIFFINVPLALVGIGLTLGCAGETSRSPDRAVDRPGQVLAVAALAVLVAATIEGGVRGFGSALVLTGFAAAAGLLGAFVAVEARGRAPMLPLGLFGSRAFSVSAAMGLLNNTAVYGLFFVLSLFFQREQGHSPLVTGVLLLPIGAAIIAANLCADRIAARLRPPRALALFGVILGAGCAGMFVMASATSYAVLVVPLMAYGFGCGALAPVFTSELLGSVPRSRSGVAAGTLNTLRQAGSAIGVALFGALVSHRFIAGAHLACGIGAGLAAGIVALTPLMRDR